MQYNMLDDGSLEPLPQPSIDTGAGLERVTMLAEGVDSAYLTDAFGDIIEVDAGLERRASTAAPPAETKALKVLADHGRAMTFLASDGIEPGNEGRGYVLRRVIRRAVQHGRRIGLEDAFLRRLHARVVELLREAHPELGAEDGARGRAAARPRRSASRARLRPAASCSTTCSRAPERRCRRRRRVQAARHLRVSDRADRRDRRASTERRVDEAGFAVLMDEQRDRARAATAGPRVDVAISGRLPGRSSWATNGST